MGPEAVNSPEEGKVTARTRWKWGLTLVLVAVVTAAFLVTGTARAGAQVSEPEIDPGWAATWQDGCVAGGSDAMADGMETHDAFGVHAMPGHMGEAHGWPDGFNPMHRQTPDGPTSEGAMW